MAPGIFNELLDAESELLVLLVNGEDLGLHHVAHMIELAGMADLLGPGNVGDVDEAVDAVLDADEHAELGDVLDGALQDGAFGVLLGHEFPGIGTDLLHAEADALLVSVNAQDDHFHLVAGVDELGRMTQLAGPGHFGNVHEALDAGLKLHEGAVVHKVGDFALDLGADGEAFGDVFPRIGNELLEAQGDLAVFAVEGEHLEGEVLAEADHFLGMADALPAHVRDVQEAVEAAEVDKDAVLGDILGLAVHDLAFGEGFKELLTLGVAFLFEQDAPGDDDVAAVAVDLENAEFEGLIDEGVHVRDRTEVHMGAGQEGFHAADIDGVAALDAAHDAAFDDLVVFLHLLELVEDLHALGLLKGQADGAVAFILVHNEDVDDVPDLNRYIALFVEEFTGGDLTFGLEVHVHQDIFFINFDDGAFDDRAFLQFAKAVV